MWLTRSMLLGSWGLLLLVAGGCGSGNTTIPVEGVVTLDGQPLEGAAVNFVPDPKGRPAHGETDAAGKFQLSTFAPGDGAIPGVHKVGVSKIEKPVGAPGLTPDGKPQLSGPPTGLGPPPMPKALVPAKYLNPSTSGITVTVEKGMEAVKIELTSK